MVDGNGRDEDMPAEEDANMASRTSERPAIANIDVRRKCCCRGSALIRRTAPTESKYSRHPRAPPWNLVRWRSECWDNTSTTGEDGVVGKGNTIIEGSAEQVLEVFGCGRADFFGWSTGGTG